MKKEEKKYYQNDFMSLLKSIFNLNNKINIIYILLLFLPIIDLITALQTRFTSFSLTIGVIVKGLLLVFIVYYLLFKDNSKNKKIISIYLISMVIFFMFYLFTKRDINGISNLIVEVINIFKFSFYPIITIGLFEMDKNKIISRDIISNILSYTVMGYILFLFLPYITHTGFKSYGLLTIKNGTVGWFYSANEIGVILILLFNFIYLHLNNKKYWLFMIVSLIGIYMSSLVGTKVASLGIIIAAFAMLFYNIIDKNRDKLKIILSIVVFASSIVFFLLGPTMSNVNDTYSRYMKNNEDEIVDKSKSQSFLISLLSDRELFLSGVNTSYKEAVVSDKLFGLGFTARESHYLPEAARLIEMDYFDIFYRFGIVGFLIITMPTIYMICFILKALFTKKINALFWKYAIIWGIVICIGFISGHVIGSPAVSIYLAIMTLFMYRSIKEE